MLRQWRRHIINTMTKFKCKPGDVVRVVTTLGDSRNEGILFKILSLNAEKSVEHCEVVWNVDGWYYGCSEDKSKRWALDRQLEVIG